ncbi:MAG: alpha-galactosidase [Erythrobacter sp.]
MADGRRYERLDGEALTLVFALERGGAADLVYVGVSLPAGEDLAALAHASARGVHESQPDTPPQPGLLPERKAGWSGTPAIGLSRVGNRIDTDFRLAEWKVSGDSIAITFTEAANRFELIVLWAIEGAGLVSTALRIVNRSDEKVTVDRLACLTLPVPRRFTEMTSYSGRWSGEMRESRCAIAPGGFARSSAIGKQGFGGGNWLLLHDPVTGEVLGAHTEWSGDYDSRLECDNQGAGDGRAMLLMGARWDPGEVVLEPGDVFESPGAIVAHAPDRSALAQALHRHLRACVLGFDPKTALRKVHLNSWEALGFDLSEDKLKALASEAAALGVERFVLDDGWFGGRRGDRTSLGDWVVSGDVFPGGLDPLIAHVHSLGMDFGLWVEPEMVSPHSDLYRAHPDWCLNINGLDRPTMRGQLVLDLSRTEVIEHLYTQLDLLLSTHDIAYLKWDHNRDLFPLAGRSLAQTETFYGILQDLGAAHPAVEIESCSSGGGRIDTRILNYTHRVWPSDNNDPIERLRIMRAWSQFLPLEVLGNHVGPSPNPITGRRTDMDFRAKVALFGHMGVEADPAAMNEAEREVLKRHIKLYKDWRTVLHSGDWFALNHPDKGVFAQIVVGDGGALAVAAQTGFGHDFDAAPVRLGGLDPAASYRVTLPQPWPPKAVLHLPDKRVWRDGYELSGEALMRQGLALPLTHPETAWLVALEKIA